MLWLSPVGQPEGTANNKRNPSASEIPPTDSPRSAAWGVGSRSVVLRAPRLRVGAALGDRPRHAERKHGRQVARRRKAIDLEATWDGDPPESPLTRGPIVAWTGKPRARQRRRLPRAGLLATSFGHLNKGMSQASADPWLQFTFSRDCTESGAEP